METTERNTAYIHGEFEPGSLVYDHSSHGEDYYMMRVKTVRTSGTIDRVPVMVKGCLLPPDLKTLEFGYVIVKGRFSSHNQRGDSKSHVRLFVFASELIQTDDKPTKNNKETRLDGYICKEPIYRETPLGRHITNLLLAVNNSQYSTSYIPCIAWGTNAMYCADFGVGSHVIVKGRIQSREYDKMLEDDTTVTKTAYELSAYYTELVDKNHVKETKDI
jgi:hypothetical protein